MKIERNLRFLALLIGCGGVAFAGRLAADELAPINIKLPQAAPKGTQLDIESGPNIEPLQTNRAPFLAPKDVVNLAAGKKVTSSDQFMGADKLAKIVDGDKAFESDSIVMVRKGAQWVQVDLGQPAEIFAIVLWHAHDTPKIYRKVIIQVSDKEDFSDAATLFNNDWDGMVGRGSGKDKEYVETWLGKLVDAKGAKGRFVRFYSKGSSESAINEYTEVEVYGRPVK